MKSVVELSEYNGEKELCINCTQLDQSYKPKDKKRILNEWINFLSENEKAFAKLSFRTRVTQELFDAICMQRKLKNLHLKWGVYHDLSNIYKLKDLQFLYIGSGSKVESVSPLSTLKSIKGLYIENFQKVQDYSPLQVMNSLDSLTICGDGTSPQYIKVDSIGFLNNMKQLKYLRLLTIRLQDGDYTPVMALVNLEHLSLRSHRDVKKIYEELVSLPNLKWGLLKLRPENYT